jgi:glycosyltransferase involved in cell wall biosynthesis
LLEHADALVTVSRATARRLAELGLPEPFVLPNFVREDSFVERSRADEGRYAFVSGRLVPEKGFDTAIAAARAARVPLLVAGDGPDGERLRGLAAGDAQVRFCGRLTEAALAEARAGAAVALAPSRWDEPCPYSVLDSLAAGVPVLVSDRGGLPELTAPHEALPPGEAGAWARALGELWGNPALRRERGEAALARARERFGEQRYYEGLIGLYKGNGHGYS